MTIYLCEALTENDDIFSLLKKARNAQEKISEAEQLLIKKRHRVINPLNIVYKDCSLETIVDTNMQLIAECHFIIVSHWVLKDRNSFYHHGFDRIAYNIKNIWRERR
jgi:hypothetical protein